MTLLPSPPPRLPSMQAVRKACKVNDSGHVPRPLLAMSSKLRSDTMITKASGRTQGRWAGARTAGKAHGLFGWRGPAATSTCVVGARLTVVMSLLSGRADQVGDDE